jgi:hypothetical protein
LAQTQREQEERARLRKEEEDKMEVYRVALEAKAA